MKIRRQSVLILVLAVMLVLFVPAHAQAATRLSLSKSTASVVQGNSFQLKASGTGSRRVRWRSSDTNIATVSSKGIVTGKNTGTCYIKAMCGWRSVTCRVTISKLSFTESRVRFVRFRSHQLRLNSGGGKKVTWTTSNPYVATVSSAGLVYGTWPGSCYITAKRAGYSCRVKVTVSNISVDALNQYYSAFRWRRTSQKRVLLAGSSTLDYWKTAGTAFSPYEVVNTAIGGTTTQQWLAWYQSLITAYKPDAVVLYVGVNNIGNGGTGKGWRNAQDTIRLINGIRSSLKTARIYYVSAVTSPIRSKAAPEINRSNASIKRYCSRTPNVYYIGVNRYFMKGNDKPNTALFRTDGLHPNTAGYQIWAARVAGPVKRYLSTLK